MSRPHVSWPLVLMWLIVIVPIQSTVLPYAAIENVAPDLLLMLLLFVSLSLRKPDVLFAAWLIGIVRGFYSQDSVGLYAIAYVLTCVVIGRLRAEMFTRHPLTRMTLTATTTLALGIVALALTHLVYRHVPPRALIRQVAIGTVYTTLLSQPVFWVFDSSRRFTHWLAG